MQPSSRILRRRFDTRFRFAGKVVWWVVAPLARLTFRIWFPLSESKIRLPTGPVVVAANHFSHLDPVILGGAVRRPMRYLAVDELYGSSRLFDGFVKLAGAIPMTRTKVPLGAIRLALSELATGGTIALFPEGVRVWAWGEQTPKRGAAWLAIRARVPLVPVAVSGSDLAMGRGARGISRAAMHVEICQPILPKAFETEPDPVGAMTNEWAARIDQALRTR